MVSNESTFNIDDLIAELNTYAEKEVRKFARNYGLTEALEGEGIGTVAEELISFARNNDFNNTERYDIEDLGIFYELQNRLTVRGKGQENKPSGELLRALYDKFDDKQLKEIKTTLDIYAKHDVISEVKVAGGKVSGTKIDVNLTWDSLEEGIRYSDANEFVQTLKEQYSIKTVKTKELGDVILFNYDPAEHWEEPEVKEGKVIQLVRKVSPKVADFAKNNGRSAAALLVYTAALATGALVFTSCDSEDPKPKPGIITGFSADTTDPGVSQMVTLTIDYQYEKSAFVDVNDNDVYDDGTDINVSAPGQVTYDVPDQPGTTKTLTLHVTGQNDNKVTQDLDLNIHENVENQSTTPTPSPHSGKILIVQNGQVQVSGDVYGPTSATLEVIQDTDGDTGTTGDQTTLGPVTTGNGTGKTATADFNTRDIGLYTNLFLKYTDTGHTRYYAVHDVLHRLFAFSELEATSLAELQSMLLVPLDKVSDPVSRDPATSMFDPFGTNHSDYKVIKLAGTVDDDGHLILPSGHNHGTVQPAFANVLTELLAGNGVLGVDDIRGAADNSNNPKGLIYKVTLQNGTTPAHPYYGGEMFVYVTQDSSAGAIDPAITNVDINAVNQIILHNIADVLDENTINTQILNALSEMAWTECLVVTDVDPNHNASLFAPPNVYVGEFNGGALIKLQRMFNPGQGDIGFLWGHNSAVHPQTQSNIDTYKAQQTIRYFGSGLDVPGFPRAELINGDDNSFVPVPGVPVVQPKTIYKLIEKFFTDYVARH